MFAINYTDDYSRCFPPTHHSKLGNVRVLCAKVLGESLEIVNRAQIMGMFLYGENNLASSMLVIRAGSSDR